MLGAMPVELAPRLGTFSFEMSDSVVLPDSPAGTRVIVELSAARWVSDRVRAASTRQDVGRLVDGRPGLDRDARLSPRDDDRGRRADLCHRPRAHRRPHVRERRRDVLDAALRDQRAGVSLAQSDPGRRARLGRRQARHVRASTSCADRRGASARQAHGEGRLLALGSHRDRAAVRVHDLLHDEQAEAQAARLGGAGFRRLPERLEQLAERFARDRRGRGWSRRSRRRHDPTSGSRATGDSRAPWVSALPTRFEINWPMRPTSQRPRSSPRAATVMSRVGVRRAELVDDPPRELIEVDASRARAPARRGSAAA